MIKQTYQKPVQQILTDLDPEVALCTSNWTDGNIGDDSENWNQWGEI